MFEKIAQSQAFTIAIVSFGCLCWLTGYSLIWHDYFRDSNGRFLQLIRESMQDAQRNDFRRAEEKLQAAIDLAGTTQHSLQVPQTLVVLADLYNRERKFKDAEGCLLQAIKHYQSLVAKNPPEARKSALLDANMQLAKTYISSGQARRAEDIYRSLISPDMLTLATVDAQSARICDEYASLLRARGENAEAAAIEQSANGEKSVLNLDTMLVRCITLISQGKPHKAEIENLLSTTMALFPERMESTRNLIAQRLVDEASRLLDYGGSQLAINYINEAQGLINDRLAKTHVGLAAEVTRARYFYSLEKAQPTAQAKTLTDSAIKLCIDGLDNNFAHALTPTLVPTLMELARLHRERGDVELADFEYGRAIKLLTGFDNALWDPYKFVAGAAATKLRLDANQRQQANSALDQASTAANRLIERRQLQSGQALDDLIDACFVLNRIDQARKYLRYSLTTIEGKKRGLLTAGLLNRLAHIAWYHDHDFPEAERLYLESEGLCRSSKETTKDDSLASTLAQRAGLYSHQGKRSDAIRLYEEALPKVSNPVLRESIQKGYEALQRDPKSG